jgi:phosphate transport system substrate-binding protein
VRDSVCQGDPLSSTLTALSTNAEVINYVAKHKDALGIIGVCWISNHGDSTHLSFLNRIKVAALTSREKATWENSYHPYQAYIFQKDYPLTRKIYAINTEPMNGLATGLTAFIAGEKGQRIILKSGIVPDNAPTRIVAVHNDDVLTQ